MTLRGPQTRLDLSIASGPDHEGWCRIAVTVETPTGRWSAIDPCLTGAEAERLASWLEVVAEGAAPGKLEFCEPELAFNVVDRLLQVELRWALRPKWADDDEAQPLCLLLPAEPEQLRRAAESLRADLPFKPTKG